MRALQRPSEQLGTEMVSTVAFGCFIASLWQHGTTQLAANVQRDNPLCQQPIFLRHGFVVE